MGNVSYHIFKHISATLKLEISFENTKQKANLNPDCRLGLWPMQKGVVSHDSHSHCKQIK